MKIVLKTDIGIEAVAASRTSDLGASCISRPGDFHGIVLVENAAEEMIAQIEGIPEVKKILPVDVECESGISQIVEAGAKVALEKIKRHESFAVRTTRRGKQEYTSVDVNVALGASICQALECDVDLDTPDKAVYVEIMGKRTYISILPGRIEQKKRKAGTVGRDITRKVSIIQLAYLYQSDATKAMGHRIGRAAQAFGVKELVLAIQEKTEAKDLMRFVEGTTSGRETRFSKQRSIESERAERVPIYVADLYQVVRERENKPIIITSAMGDPLSQCANCIRHLFDNKGINVFIGARRGIPTGIFRFADVVVDLCPGLTYATEHGIPAAIVAITACIQGYDME